MTITIALSDDYKWVALALFASQILLGTQSGIVGNKRIEAKIAYPQLYAEKAEAAASREAYVFNCAQRAHQNTLESYSTVVLGTLITSAHFPRYAAGACAAWVLGKAIYTRGYLIAPDKRNSNGGILGHIAMTAILLGSATSVVMAFL